MAQGLETLDAQFPTFLGNESPRTMVRMLTDYIFQQTQTLQFVLANLNTKNWNAQDLKEFQNATTKQVAEDIKKINGSIKTINESVDNLKAAVEALQQLTGEHTTSISALQTKVQQLNGSVTNLLKTINADGSGGGTIGKEGQRLDLIGNVYINGKLV